LNSHLDLDIIGIPSGVHRRRQNRTITGYPQRHAPEWDCAPPHLA